MDRLWTEQVRAFEELTHWHRLEWPHMHAEHARCSGQWLTSDEGLVKPTQRVASGLLAALKQRAAADDAFVSALGKSATQLTAIGLEMEEARAAWPRAPSCAEHASNAAAQARAEESLRRDEAGRLHQAVAMLKSAEAQLHGARRGARNTARSCEAGAHRQVKDKGLRAKVEHDR